ncbi:cytochrome P450 [Apodospora peruviana]|uniref:Cytochrome P450 n=1 Tax=Apodospora peruviana TaxID=516989 RepID=A0AAE0M244_9PEZI|nr:cytochrome P450 [Apodospora peruviana]
MLDQFNSTFLRYFDDGIVGDAAAPAAPGGTVLFTSVLAITLSLYALLYHLQKQPSHPDEPPIIPSTIPFIGHLLGMAVEGGRYIKNIGLRNRDKPIFTLPVLKSRIYIVTDPSLAAAVQRASKALSFTPLIPDITKRVLGLDTATVDIVRQHLDPEPGERRGFLADMHDMVYSYLGPGEALNELSLGAAQELAAQVNAYVTKHSTPETVSLLHWVRHFVTIGTAEFLYGPENPISKDQRLEEAFWDFDHGLGSLLMNILPSVTARKPYYGREALAAALTKYLEQEKHKSSASKIVKNRVEIALRHGWTLQAASRSEVSFLFAGIVNTATTTFWVVLQIFARERLLEAVRRELLEAVTVKGSDSVRVLSLERVKNGSCPALTAVFRECLRVGSDNYSTRLVKTDTVLAGKWFLQKDSVVQIAGGVMHADPRIWGQDANEFNERRFLKTETNGNGNGISMKSTSTNSSTSSLNSSNGTIGGNNVSGVHPAAFRAFGGGKTLCPGRHFATNEILAFVAMIVLTFDLEPAESGKQRGGEKIRAPAKEDGVLPVHILEPKEDVMVRVVVRDGRRIEVV